MNPYYDVIVIGAGQAGLAMGYVLKQTNLSFTLLDAHAETGASWRNRYDSLVLFTPRSLSALPGLPFPGDPDSLPNKDDVANYLQLYAKTFDLPIIHNSMVRSVRHKGDRYEIQADSGIYNAGRVVVATGPFQHPQIPPWAAKLPDNIIQLHTSQYKNPAQIPDGTVLLVGNGNSGAQIAAELSATHPVYLATGRPRRHLPQTLWGKNIFTYLKWSGLLSVTVDSPLGQWLSRQPDPLFGWGEAVCQLSKGGQLRLLPRAISADGEGVLFQNGERVLPQAVIWSTGFRPDYRWLEVEGILDHRGFPLHRRGISPIEGLYFLGLPWQYRRTSALLAGVGADAAYLVQHMLSPR